VNGNAVSANGTTAILNTNNLVTKIGATGFTPKDFFQGTIDEVRIYDRALTVHEIQLLLNIEETTQTVTPTPVDTESPVVSPTPASAASPAAIVD